MPDKLQKLAQEALGDMSIDHDLDETLKLLVKHRENGYAGLGYEAKNDGEGGRTVTIHFPSPSDAAKYEAMVEQGVDPAHLTEPGDIPKHPPEMPADEPGGAMAANNNVVVRIAMDDEKSIEKELRTKYPKEFLENMGIV